MFLKSLEVENFKSFKGEAVIPFDRGFTAITGLTALVNPIVVMQFSLYWVLDLQKYCVHRTPKT